QKKLIGPRSQPMCATLTHTELFHCDLWVRRFIFPHRSKTQSLLLMTSASADWDFSQGVGRPDSQSLIHHAAAELTAWAYAGRNGCNSTVKFLSFNVLAESLR
ncbi:hypothetical protein GOODEAATRI_017433, partial [Goodea atripinnis]